MLQVLMTCFANQDQVRGGVVAPVTIDVMSTHQLGKVYLPTPSTRTAGQTSKAPIGNPSVFPLRVLLPELRTTGADPRVLDATHLDRVSVRTLRADNSPALRAVVATAAPDVLELNRTPGADEMTSRFLAHVLILISESWSQDPFTEVDGFCGVAQGAICGLERGLPGLVRLVIAGLHEDLDRGIHLP